MRENSILMITSASVVFQFAAAGLALRLIRVSGRMWAWMLVASALLVMGIRRFVALWHIMSGSQSGDLTVELLGLLISLLMLSGIALIRPLFEELNRSRRGLLESKAELETINRTLEERVAAEVHKNLEKDRIMILREREAAMGEMVSGIAHQWKQPLNNLSLTLQALQYESHDRSLQDGDVDRAVAVCLDLVQHMSATIDEFRTFFMPQDSNQQFSLAHEVAHALRLVSAGFDKNSINVSCTVEQDTALTGSPNECSQVILSILQNCQEAFEERTINDPRVAIRIFRESGHAVVTASDNAGGIPDGVLATMFEAYATTKCNGSGIGLYLSRMIVEKKFGGSITAHNIDGGAEIRVDLQS